MSTPRFWQLVDGAFRIGAGLPVRMRLVLALKVATIIVRHEQQEGWKLAGGCRVAGGG